MKKKITKLLAMLTAALCLLGAAVSVSAAPYLVDGELTTEEAQEYSDSLQMEFMLSMMLSDISELVLPQLEESGDYFYETMAAQIKDSYGDLGVYEETKSIAGEIEDGELTLTYMIKCEKLDAEVIMTFKIDQSAGSITPLNFTLNPQYPMAVNMSNAARNTVIGVVIVFCILAFLSFVISLLKFINPDLRKKKASAEAPAKEEKPQVKAAPVPAAEEVTVSSKDEEIAAVIAAAIAAATADADANDNSTYVVSSIRRVSNGKRWKRA